MKEEEVEIMVNNKCVEEFKKVINKGKWRERYRVVKNNYFITNNLVEEPVCQSILINTALKDKVRLVRQEALRTCQILKLMHKGKEIQLRKMPSLFELIGMNRDSIKERVFLIIMQTEVPIYPRNRRYGKKAKKIIRNAFEKECPKLYDTLDGWYTYDIHKNGNDKLENFLIGCLNNVSSKRIIKYYAQNPERLEYENSEYRDMLEHKIEIRTQNGLKHKELESEM